MDQSQSVARVSPVFTKVAIDYFNQDSSFVALQVLPMLKVETDTGIYFQFDKSALRQEQTLRADGTYAAEARDGLSQVTYGPIEDHSLWGKVTDKQARQMGGMTKALNSKTRKVMGRLLIRREIDAKAVLDAAITNTVTLSGTTQWSDSSSDPVSAVKTARETVKLACLMTPNTLVLSYPVWSALLVHPQIIGRLNGLSVAANKALLANILDVQNIIVADAAYNSARQGAADSVSYIWGKDAYLCYVAADASEDVETMTLGHTLTLTAEDGETPELSVLEWRDARGKFNGVEPHMSYSQKVMAAEAGYRFINAVA